MTKGAGDTRTKYDRIARIYDIWDAIPERLFYRSWRYRLWNKVGEGTILEIGVGTGKNIAFYQPGAQVTAIDISSNMLREAAAKSCSRPDVSVVLLNMDVGELAFGAGVFDIVVGSFVLTVVPDPLKALREVRRVCKPGGKLLLLEFTHSSNRVMALFQGLVTPLTRAIYCAHINREIIRLVEHGGFRIVAIEDVGDGIVRIIQAEPC